MIIVDAMAKLHEEALVVSGSFELALKEPGDAEKLIDAMKAGMEKTNAWAAEKDVFIGHVKGYITWGESDEAIMLSTVGEDVQIKGSETRPVPPCTVKVGTANIVFGTELHEVEERVEEYCAEVLAAFGEECDFCCEHEDDCECGCHDHDHEDGEHHHHHHHDHEHHHDHDHEHHHHEHEHHGEDCDCGCHDHEDGEHHHHHHDHEHEHEHHHDHEHEHEHHHEHDHEHEHHHDHDHGHEHHHHDE